MERTDLSPEVLLEQRSWMERLARGLVGDAQAAEDLVQEAFITALRQPPEGAGDPPRLRAWLARVVRRGSLQWRRSEGRRRRRQESVARAEALPPTDALVARAELQRNVADALVGLAEPYRRVLLLRYFEGLSSAEIARRNGLPAATVRSQLKRGLELLREELDRGYGGDRGLWCGLLATWLPVPALPPIAESGSIPVLQGALVMKGALQIVLACVLVLMAAVGWRSWTASDGALAGDEQSGLSAVSPALGEAESADEELVADSGAEGRRDALAEAPPKVVPSSEAVDLVVDAVTVLARIVDENGMGLVGAELRTLDLEASAFSGVGGGVRLEVPLSEGERTLEVAASHPARATRWLSARFRAGQELNLGDLVLEPAGALAGLVVDSQGRPLGGARVVVGTLENERRDPEELRRLGPTFAAHAPETTSLADGSFRIEGAAARSTRVWASAEGFAWSGVGPLEVLRERDVEDVRLVLEPLREDDRIEGLVLRPDGAPAADAVIDYWFFAAKYGTGGSLSVDAEGRFSMLLEQRVPYDLTIRDSKDRWASLHIPRVPPGERELVLRFVEPEWMELSVVDGEGRPVEEFGMGAYPLHEKFDSFERSWKRERPGGLARMRRPREAFVVRIEARGYEEWESETYPAQSQVETLVATLTVLPGLTGRVVSRGKPVARARLTLHAMAEDGTRIVKNGFRSLVNPHVIDEVRSDAQGRFQLFPKRDGTYRIFAEAEGFARTDMGPLEVSLRLDSEPLEIELGVGGAIEGRVLLPEGVDPSGVVVGFNRGDGDARTLRVGADGRYRLEELCSGSWSVERRREEIDPGRSSVSFSSVDAAEPMVFDCEVFDGQTTHFDLDLRDEPACLLRGRLDAEGADLGGWTASLARKGAVIGGEVLGSTLLAEDGSFELELELPGEYQLRLQAPSTGSGRLQVEEGLRLVPGENSWQLTALFGRIEGSGASASRGSEELLEYVWLAQPEGRSLEISQRIVVDGEGGFVLPVVPVGRGKITEYRPPAPGESWGEWSELAEFEVEAGRALELLLP